VPLSVFDQLLAGDILLIDSTHIAKVGSDVMTLVFQILPRPKPGVAVHLHDIFYPFEYLEEWIMTGRAWNEAYLLHAFLIGNTAYRILLWNSYLAAVHHDAVAQRMPIWEPHPGGSLWLERTAVN
jgi:hypothetical protein